MLLKQVLKGHSTPESATVCRPSLSEGIQAGSHLHLFPESPLAPGEDCHSKDPSIFLCPEICPRIFFFFLIKFLHTLLLCYLLLLQTYFNWEVRFTE